MGAIRAAFVFGIALSGCGSSTTEVDSGIQPEEVPAKLAEWTCGTLEECAGEMWDLFVGLSHEECVDAYTQGYADGFVPRLNAAIEEGTVEYDANRVQDCLDALEALGCAGLENRVVDECEDAIHGTVPEGGDCGIDVECEGSAFCLVEASCPGTCTARYAEGHACSGDSSCQSGLVCQGTCVTPSREGQDCEGPGNAPGCEVGLICRGGGPDTTGTCAEVTDLMTEPLRGDCNFLNGTLCEVGLSCVLTSATPTFECQTATDSGAACTLSFPDHCPDGEWCAGLDPDGGDIDGTCRPIPGDGEACANYLGDPECEAGLACDHETDPTNPTCTTVESIGGNCNSDAGCYSGVCDYGSCVEPDKCVEPD